MNDNVCVELKTIQDSVSPKTPGGISKSFLTPYKRLGLSRKFKHSGPSPFRSPLSQNNANLTPEQSIINNKRCLDSADITTTPTRDVSVSRRKKTKLTSITNRIDDETLLSDTNKDKNINSIQENEVTDLNAINNVIEPIQNELRQVETRNNDRSDKSDYKDQSDIKTVDKSSSETQWKISKKCPSDLSKKCVVIIRKQLEHDNVIINNGINMNVKNVQSDSKINKSTLINDSDSDSVPLSTLKKESGTNVSLADDSDFSDMKINVSKVKKLEHKKTSTTDLNKSIKINKKNKNNKKSPVTSISVADNENSSQNSILIDDDDDFDDTCKKTILIKKTYKPPTKTVKENPVPSITDNLRDLKLRIEKKRNLLLKKSDNIETMEVIALIKKWHLGFQDALVELLELMKLNMPEQEMNCSKLLKTFNIPHSLAGYDEENDCFVSDVVLLT